LVIKRHISILGVYVLGGVLPRTVSYSGVVVGVESLEGFGELLVVQGEVDGVSLEFYLKLSETSLKRILELGIGARVSGVGVVVSEDPLVVSSRE
jgi:hypothetical protein